MRSFLAGLALFLAFVTGTIALSAYVAETVLLDPSRAGEVVGKALSRADVREEILTRAVPGYDRLDPRSRRRRRSRPFLHGPQGAGRRAALRRRHHPPRLVARRARQRAPGQRTGRVRRPAGGRRHRRGHAARRATRTASRAPAPPPGAPGRRPDWPRSSWPRSPCWSPSAGSARSARSASPCCCAAPRWHCSPGWLPSFVRASSSDPLVGVGASVLRSEWTSVLVAMLPVAVVGGALVVLGLFGARSRH